ncbi:MAG: hypothetical protein H0X62_16370 [Bacteroidetes bacterium]|nr:hypothetical protein [Bacteroidota bacterium]
MTEQTTINFYEKRDFGQKVNLTFSFIRLTYRSLFRNLLLFAAPIFVLSGVLGAVNQLDGMASFSGNVMFTLLITYFLYAVGTVFSAIIAGKHILIYQKEGRIDISTEEMMTFFKNDFFKIFITSFIYYLIILVGSVLLFIPGIYLAIALSLCMMIRILNPEAELSFSFKESMRLIKGNWWASFGFYFIIGIISYVFALVFMIPYLASLAFIGITSPAGVANEGFRFLVILTSAIGQLGYAFTTCIPFVGISIYYYSLREQKDDVNMQLQINEIGNIAEVKTSNEGSY